MRLLAFPRWTWAVVMIASAGLVATLWAVDGGQDGRSPADEAVEVARAQVLDLTTIDTESFEAALESLRARSVAQANSKLSASAKPFAEAVQTSLIETTEGRIQSSGVVSSSEEKAVVLVASSAKVSVDNAEPVLNYYRLKVTLAKVDQEWKVSDMGFVS